MTDTILTPDVRTLLPPLLACLPTAFASPRPPPALLPLLSPILRQRVQLLSASAESPTESWLPLLCWKPGAAKRLPSIVESEAFELHPVSGEIEYGELGSSEYKQLDEETLQAKVEIQDLQLTVLYAWVQNGQDNNGSRWLVAEIMPMDYGGQSVASGWHPSIAIATEKAEESQRTDGDPGKSGVPNGLVPQVNGAECGIKGGPAAQDDSDDDDDYWAQYDSTPGRTPAANRSPMRGPDPSTESRGRSASEAAYFEQYSQVQPEMDNDDPSENRLAIGASSLDGNVVTGSTNQGVGGFSSPMQQCVADKGYAPVLSGFDSSERRSSPLGTAKEAESQLQGSPAEASSSETAIKQHVSTSIKSLFRLCRGAGIERPEFEEMINTELETLGLLAEDD